MTTLPNLLTLSRIAVIPAFVGAFYLAPPLANWVTFGLFVLAGVTDYLDGHFARTRDAHSAFGRFLDPIADKLLVAAAILMMVAHGRITGATIVAALVILCREILVSGLREFLAGAQVSVPVSQLAKWKTTLQIVALAALLLGDAVPFALPGAAIGAWGLWLAAALTLYTGYDYLRAGLRHMRGREPAPRPGQASHPAE